MNIKFGKNKKGFTLAEVLITLGIIGVVAAMTIPNLMTNIQGARTRTQFKKAISTLNQAIRLNIANYDWDFAGIHYSTCNATVTPEDNNSFCAIMNANLTGETFLEGVDDIVEYPNLSSNWNYKYTSLGNFVLYQLQDGAIIGIDTNNSNCSKNGARCMGFIDINGTQLPNKQIECSDPTKTKGYWETGYEECIVKITGRTGDIFDIVFQDSAVIPATNAAKYVLNTAK